MSWTCSTENRSQPDGWDLLRQEALTGMGSGHRAPDPWCPLAAGKCEAIGVPLPCTHPVLVGRAERVENQSSAYTIPWAPLSQLVAAADARDCCPRAASSSELVSQAQAGW
jgi:hypothetical protein